MQAAVGTVTRFLGVSPNKEISSCQNTDDLNGRFSPKTRINKNATHKRSTIPTSDTSHMIINNDDDDNSSMSDIDNSEPESGLPEQQQQQQQQSNNSKPPMPDSMRSDAASSVAEEDEDKGCLHNNNMKRNLSENLLSDEAGDEPQNENDEESVLNRRSVSSPLESKATSEPLGHMSDLTSKIQELHTTLARIRQEHEAQLEKLKQDSENATKTIERLQMQLQQQSDYNLLKRELQLLRSAGGVIGDAASNALLAAAMSNNNPLTSTPSSTTSSLTLTPPPPVPLTSGPPSGGSPSTLLSGMPPSSLEQLLVERAKAIRQANPALKAFADLQGSPQFPGLGGPMRHPLFHPHGGLPQGIEALGLMNEEMVAQWRQSLQRSPLSGLGLSAAAAAASISPYHHLAAATTPPTSRTSGEAATPLPPSTPMTPPMATASTPSHQPPRTPNQKFVAGEASPEQHGTPSNGHSSPTPDRPDSPNAANGDSTAQSEADEEASSPALLDNKSPFKPDERPSPSHPLSFPGPPGLNLQFPLHMGVSPLVSSGRIPKSDPMEGRLQDMLRYNMEKYAGQALDTLGTSRRVRELLSIHNIGQRLFAKYVLGLSQGTVSELLSKPKCWEKLTEKGRDSYRKMHAWAYDENAVMMLKSLIPRKGELMRPLAANPLLMKDDRTPVGTPNFPFGPGEASEERIAKILNDANKAISANAAGAGKEMSRNTPPTSVANPLSFSSQLLASSPLCDDNPHETLAKIYKDEFSRIMQETSRLNSGGSDKPSPEILSMAAAAGLPFFPGIGAASSFFGRGGPAGNAGSGPSGPAGLPSSSDYQRAMDIYHQEFSRLQQNALAVALRSHQQSDLPGFPASVSSSRDETSNRGDDGDDNGDNGDPYDQRACSPDGSERSGPNSPSDGGQDSPIGKGPRSNLFPPPPLQQLGDDLAGSLSPLQRMASITNSLVSQPNMSSQGGQQHRTHRAILPPITQQQFDRFQHLNTDDVVRRVKEILSQYSISQRLFGEHVLALSQGSVSDLLARPKPWHMLTQKGREPFIRMKLFLDDENAVHKLVASQYKIAPDKLMRTGNYSGQLPLPPKQLGKMPEFHPAIHDVLPSSFRFAPDSLQDRSPPILDPLALQRKLISQKTGAGLAGGVVPATASLYEMAALTHELDTQAVTTKVKEILLANNVGQKLFGEAVLGLSQGSVSELLSKPKPWHMLSIKGREPFIRMQLWLNDAHNIEKLQSLKSERKDSFLGKRKRLGGGLDSSSDRSSPADSSDMYANQVDSPGSAKKARVLFSDEQKEALNVAFTLEPYPSTTTMEFLSQELNLEPRSISNWFHNHRMRLKQVLPQAAEQLNAFAGKESQTFDPVKFRLLFHQRMMDVRSDDSGSRGTNDDNVVSGGSFAVAGLQPNFSSLLRQFGSFHSSLDQLCSKDSKEEKEIGGVAGGGLDLTLRRSAGGGDNDDDKDSIAESDSEEDSQAASIHNKRHKNEAESESEDGGMHAVGINAGSVGSRAVSAASSRSRRKPAAPQWLRPEWMESGGSGNEADDKSVSKSTTATSTVTGNDKENNLTINGVCVMNSYATLSKTFEAAAAAAAAAAANVAALNNKSPSTSSTAAVGDASPEEKSE